jgi:hypothetical protein
MAPCDLDKIVDRTWRSPAGGEVIYHYTSYENAEKILRSRSFWLTSHRCTNDAGELRSADKRIASEATTMFATRQGRASRSILQAFVDGYTEQRVDQKLTAYLACFSLEGDDRCMWYRYGGAGRGLCLGIKVIDEALPNVVGLGRGMIVVSYQGESWIQAVRERFTEVCDCVDSGQARDTDALNALYRIAAHTAMAVKAAPWSREREIRLTAITNKDFSGEILHHNGRERLPLSARDNSQPLALGEVIIGPSATAGFDDVGRLLAETGYGGPEPMPVIKRSASARSLGL